MITKKLENNILELVSIDEAKDHSRITDYDDDENIQANLDAAHNLVEQWLNRKIIPTKMVGFIEEYKNKITLPYPPIISIDSITADDKDGTNVTIPTTDYKFNSIVGSVKFLVDYNLYTDFNINYTCGYITNECPIAVKHAIKMTFATLYEMREDAIIGTQVNEIPVTARNIIKSFRVRSAK